MAQQKNNSEPSVNNDQEIPVFSRAIDNDVAEVLVRSIRGEGRTTSVKVVEYHRFLSDDSDDDNWSHAVKVTKGGENNGGSSEAVRKRRWREIDGNREREKQLRRERLQQLKEMESDIDKTARRERQRDAMRRSRSKRKLLSVLPNASCGNDTISKSGARGRVLYEMTEEVVEVEKRR